VVRLEPGLDPVQETLFIPLYGRATLTRQGSALIDDRRAVELGVGLNTRFERLDDGHARWFELDLPEAMALRRRFFSDEERRTMLSGSVVDGAWVEAVAETGGPWFVVAEAVLPFLTEADARTAIGHMARFSGSRLAFDTWSSWMAEHQDEHDALSRTDARVAWFVDDVPSLREWEPALRLVESRTLPDGPPPVLELVPPEMTAALQAVRETPQVASYRLNVFRTEGLTTPP
jgi:O-methyltransferase involved in polyketide biosynthesis